MLFKKYTDFIGKDSINLPINENVQQAKTFLKNRALAAKKEQMKPLKDGEEAPKVSLSAEEVKQVENDPNFLKIKELLKDSAGYVFAFTKFFFLQEAPFDELKDMYAKIKEFKAFLSTLPMPVEKYADIMGDDTDHRNGFERLMDDIENLSRVRIAKRWVDNLYGNVRREYTTTTPANKKRIENIAVAFNEFGGNPDGSKDEKKNYELQALFFNKIRRHTTLHAVMAAAEAFIKSAANDGISNFLQAIQKTNHKFGELNGAEIVYDENDFLIIELKSHHACKELCSNTSWCIASSRGQWDNYVGGDEKFTKQYAILNFNLPPNDDKSIIGITIQPGGGVYACHTKSDAGFSTNIKDYMTKWKVPFDILAPMSNEEQQIKKKRVLANKEIIKSDISIDKIKQLIEDGGDPNAKSGTPLKNAIKEDNYEKVKFLLDHGASANIGDEEKPIKEARSLEMIKLLVDHGSELVGDIFNNYIIKSYDAVKYILDAGIDANFEKGLPLRSAVKVNNDQVIKLLVENGARVQERRFMAVKFAVEYLRLNLLKYLLDTISDPRYPMDEDSLKKAFGETGYSHDKKYDTTRKKWAPKFKKDMIDWAESSVQETVDKDGTKMEDIVKFLEDYMK